MSELLETSPAEMEVNGGEERWVEGEGLFPIH